MFIIASHTIQDPDTFWSIARREITNIPPQLKLHGIFPSTSMMRSICLWEAESPEALNTLLRQLFGDTSRDELFEVNEDVAIGLPLVPKAV